ncbi:TPA: hypothetical protein ONC25_004425 [Enterobacter asburiae]|nr:hypothetical protein [Enterobacter asburiae]
MNQNSDIDLPKIDEHSQNTAQKQTAHMQISEDEISVKIDNVISVRLLAF